MIRTLRSQASQRLAALALLAVLALVCFGLPQHTSVSQATVVQPRPRWIRNSDQRLSDYTPPTAILQAAGTIYVGGRFSQLGAPSTLFGSLQPAGGQFVADLPRLDGVVTSIVGDGAGGWFVGGHFSAADQPELRNLIHINADKTLDRGWNPNISDFVDRIVHNGVALYIQSRFLQNSTLTERLISVDIRSARRTGWERRAAANERFQDIAFGMGRVIVVITAGNSSLTALDPADAQHVLWSSNLGASDPSYALAVDGNSVFLRQTYGVTKFDIGSGALLPFPVGIGPCDQGGGEAGPGFCASIDGMAADNGVVYIHGDFSRAGNPNHYEDRSGWAALSAATGALLPWQPQGARSPQLLGARGGKVYALSSSAVQAFDGSSGAPLWTTPMNNVKAAGISRFGAVLYRDLSFQSAPARSNLAAFDPATGALTGWAPQADGPVYRLVLNGDRLYAMGNFTRIDGQARPSLAAFDAASGALLDWNPQPDAGVQALSASDGRLYVYGSFSQIAGQPRQRLAVFDTSGALLDWTPAESQGGVAFPGETITAVATVGNTVYLVSSGRAIAEGFQITAFDRTSGARAGWSAVEGLFMGGSFDALIADGATLYVAGTFPQGGLLAFDTTRRAAPAVVWPGKATRGLVRKGRDLYFGTDAGLYRLNLDTKALAGPFGQPYLPDGLADGGDSLLGSWCRWNVDEPCRFATYSPAAPPVATGPADGLSGAGATLHGTVNPNGTSAAVSFQLTTRRGDCDAIRTLPAATAVLTGDLDQAVSLTLADLAPSTTYFYRLVASSPLGVSYGEVQQFTTPAGAALAPTALAGTAAPAQLGTDATPATPPFQVFLPALRRCPAASEGF